MTWTSSEIKELRLRLGWSIAQMARHLSCGEETVQAFEKSNILPDPEVRHQLEHLLNCVESNAEKTLNEARAERQLKTQGLDQIHEDEMDSDF